MTDTDFYVPDDKGHRLATLYGLDGDRNIVDVGDEPEYGGSYRQVPLLEYGGAGLVGTPGDYLRFAQMLLNKGELDGVRVLRPESVRAMTSDQLDVSLGPPTAFGDGTPAGDPVRLLRPGQDTATGGWRRRCRSTCGHRRLLGTYYLVN
jgi:CubicO group peptidase (beta-lactamase class C family)